MSAPRHPSYPLTVEQFSRMVELGILSEGDPCELLEGVLRTRPAKTPLHSVITASLLSRLADAFGLALVRIEQPIRAGDHSLPEPDLAVTRAPRSAWRKRHPDGSDVILVVEVAVSSLSEDRSKTPIYAAAGVEVFWILDVPDRTLWEHRGARTDGAWRETRALGDQDEVEVPGTPLRWRVADLLDEA